MGICHTVKRRSYSPADRLKPQSQTSPTIHETKMNTDTQPLESNKRLIESQEQDEHEFKKSNTQGIDTHKINHSKTKSLFSPNSARTPLPNAIQSARTANPKKLGFVERTPSLRQRRKNGSKLIKEEFKLCITNQTLIEEIMGVPTTKYKILSTIGDGSYGTVFLAENNQTKKLYAMKKIEKLKEKEIDDLALKNELDILKKLDHPNIVKVYEFYDTQTSYFIITEYCQKGELFGYFKKSQFTESQLAVLFYQIFSGLVYLHENNIIHRDLKLSNILISDIEKDKKTSEEYLSIKIIDFGAAKIFNRNKSEKAIVGSSFYMAPEVIKQKYNEKCDTWSIGIILYMLIVGKPPFDGSTDEEIMEAIENGFYNGNHRKLLSSSKEIQDLIKKLLCKNINNRLSAKEALNHSWFKAYNGRRLYSNFDNAETLPYIRNLMSYSLQSKVQQFVLAFLVHNVSIENEKDILKLFRHFNLKGDCKLTKEELLEGLSQFNAKEDLESHIDELFLLLDGDNNGFIEYEEFLRACVDKKEILNDTNLRYAFQFLDKNNTGTISINSLKKALLLNNKQFEEVFKNTIKQVDHDNDGEITFAEFKELMLTMIRVDEAMS